MEAFVYMWYDKKFNMFYIGCHKGQENDGYVCSSKTMLAEYKKRPNDFTRSIIDRGSWKDMADLEVELQQYFNVRYNDNFYNTQVARAIILSEETIKKTAEKLKGRKLSKQHKDQISKTLKGRKWSKEYKENMSRIQTERWKNREYTDQERQNRSRAQTGRIWNEESKKKLSNSHKNKVWITDGTNNKKINKTDAIPEGWRQGRVMPWWSKG